MASTRRPRALPAYICALLVVCAVATSAFAASTFNVNLTTPDGDITGIATDSSSNNAGDVGTANPAVTHLILGDSIQMSWVSGTHEMEQTNSDCSVSACLFAPGFDSGLSATPRGAGPFVIS